MLKITSANESQIDTLNISSATKSVFHQAIANGRIVYTPTKPVTYGTWSGLFYITLNTVNGSATYSIGEGLNGGYSACGLPGVTGGICNWAQSWVDFLKKHSITTTSTIISPTNNQNFILGDNFTFEVLYKHMLGGATLHQWTEKMTVKTDDIGPGPRTITGGYGTGGSVNINVIKVVIGIPEKNGNNDSTFDQLVDKYMKEVDLPPGVLKTMISHESGGNKRSIRYEPCKDIELKSLGLYSTYPFSYWLIGGSGGLTTGVGAANFAQNNSENLSAKQMVSSYSLKSFKVPTSTTPTVYEVWNNNRSFYSTNCPYVDPTAGNYPAQFIISSSYGLGQLLYTTAINQKFNKDKNGTDFNPPKNPWILLDNLEENIKAAVSLLKANYDIASTATSPRGYPGKDCKSDGNYSNDYFEKIFGTKSWVAAHAATTTLVRNEILNGLSIEKDDLWWAVRWYVGDSSQTIKDANDRCALYHNQQ